MSTFPGSVIGDPVDFFWLSRHRFAFSLENKKLLIGAIHWIYLNQFWSTCTGSPMTDPGKVDTYYNYNEWKISKAQAIILFHMKVHFVWIDKNYSIFENHGYFVDQSQKQFFNHSGWFLTNEMYQKYENRNFSIETY